MALVDLRQRTGYLFLGVILGHVLLISAQVNTRKGVPILESVVFGAFSEVQRVSSTAISAFRHTWSGYVGLRDATRENEQLKQRLAAAEVELQQQRALAGRAKSLEQLLEMRPRVEVQTAAAEIIG